MHVAELKSHQREWTDEHAAVIAVDTTPKCSVIIPCRNEAKRILRVLEDLALQSIGDPFEVLIADGESDDGTWEILHQFKESALVPFKLILLRNHQLTIPCALNLLVQKSRGKFIVRVDAHSRIPPNYLEQIVHPLESGACDVAGPQIRFIPSGGGAVPRTIAAVCNSRMGNGGTPSRTHLRLPVEVDHTVMSCFTRRVWEKIGGYDQMLQANEDFDYDYRAAKAGFRVLSLPNPVYSLLARSDLGTLVRQRWRYGFWKAQVLKKFPTSLKLRQLLPIIALPVALLLLLSPTALALAAACYLAMVFISLNFSLLKEKSPNPVEWLKIIGLSIVVMLIVHFVWSAGVWVGLLVPQKTAPATMRGEIQTALH